MFYFKKYIYIYIYIYWHKDLSVRHLSGRTRFNPRSSHTKGLKNGTWWYFHYKVQIKGKLSNPEKGVVLSKREIEESDRFWKYQLFSTSVQASTLLEFILQTTFSYQRSQLKIFIYGAAFLVRLRTFWTVVICRKIDIDKFFFFNVQSFRYSPHHWPKCTSISFILSPFFMFRIVCYFSYHRGGLPSGRLRSLRYHSTTARIHQLFVNLVMYPEQ